MVVPWHVTSWRYNFRGTISSRNNNRRNATIFKVYYLCLLLGAVIAWAIVKDKATKQVILFMGGMFSIPVWLALTIYLLYYSYNGCYQFYYKCLKKQRKSLKENRNNLKNTLLAFNEQVPNTRQFEFIERKARQYLQPIYTQIDKILLETDLILTGSAVERYGIPFSNLLELSEMRSGFISTLTFCCMESMQREDLKAMSDSRHALLSDFDYMISLKNEMVSFNEGEQKYKAFVEKFPFYIIKEGNEEFHAKKLKYDLLKVAEKIDVGLIPPHLFGDERNNNNFVHLYVNGPALTLKIGTAEQCKHANICFYADMSYSLKCPEWPQVSDWTERANKKWPNPEDIERIKSLGCHFVAKSDPQDSKGRTWRISFSKAEVELSKLVPNAARLCLVGLKIIRKDYLAVVCNKLKSYHLKCILLYILETNDPSIWKEDNLELCFELLLKSLKTCLEKQMVPFFWLSTFNLIDNFTRKDLKNLLKQLDRVEANPSKFIEPLRMRHKYFDETLSLIV